MIVTPDGQPASRLGFAAHPKQNPACVRTAFDGGINYFFFYGPGNKPFIKELAPLVRSRRPGLIIGTGSGARKRTSLMAVRRQLLAALGTETLDVFFAEYVSPSDQDTIFRQDGVLDILQQWKSDGLIRYVGASTHDHSIAQQLATDSRVDVLMHRFNMAHRKAAREVFPTALRSRTPVVAFTATRWGTLLESYEGWTEPPPTAVDCYRYCLSEPAIQIVLTAPKSVSELEQNLAILRSKSMKNGERSHWDRFGDLVYGAGQDRFETEWP